MRIAAAALFVALSLACDAQPTAGPSAVPRSIGGLSGSPLLSESGDASLVTVDFRENSGRLNLRFASDWDVRDVGIVCNRFNHSNDWGPSFTDTKPAAPANSFTVDDYSRQLQEAGIYRCSLTRQDETPDVVVVRFSTGDWVSGVPSSGGSSFYSLGPNIEPFGMLAGSAVTCTGSTVTGNVGVSPGSSVTGIPGLCTHNGTITSTPVAAAAQADLTSAYNSLSTQPCSPLAASLNGVTVTPGVYCIPAAVTNLTGTFTLSGAGAYTFISSSTLITSAGSNVNLINGAGCAGVNWVVGSSATIGGSISGNVISASSISTGPGANLHGRFLANGGAVTITGSTVSNASCS
jgi:hypothetical protein